MAKNGTTVSITIEGSKTEAMVIAAEILGKLPPGDPVVSEMQEAGAKGRVVIVWSGTI